MKPIRIRNNESYVSAIVPVAFVAAIGLHAQATGVFSKSDAMLSALFLAISAIAGWIRYIQNQRWVEINAPSQTVSVHTVSPLFFRSTVDYPLNNFSAVRSYITSGRFSSNRIELVTHSGGEGLLIAALQNAIGAKSFWSTSTDTESPQATELRKAIAAYAGIADKGFEGPRMVGAQVKSP